MTPKICLAALPLALAAAPAVAATFASPAAIDAAVASFLGAETGTPGGAARPVDRRLKLAACAEALDVNWYGRAGTTLQVSCLSQGWRIFVATSGNGPSSGRAGLGGETIVQKGETVSLSYEGSGFTLTRQGEALESGARNQWIKVKPIGDAKPVRGKVVRPGSVSVSAE